MLHPVVLFASRSVSCTVWCLLLLVGCGASSTASEPAPARISRSPTDRTSTELDTAALVPPGPVRLLCEAAWDSGAVELDDELAQIERGGEHLRGEIDRHPEYAPRLERILPAIADAGPSEVGGLMRRWALSQGASRCREADVRDFSSVPLRQVADAALFRLEGDTVFHQLTRLGPVGEGTTGALVLGEAGATPSAVLILGDESSWGSLRLLLNVVNALGADIPVYVRGAIPLVNSSGSSVVRSDRSRCGGGALSGIAPRLTFRVSSEGVVIERAPADEVIATRDGEAATRRIAPLDSLPSDGRDEVEDALVDIAPLAVSQFGGIVDITATDDVPVGHVTWLSTTLTSSPAIENIEVRLVDLCPSPPLGP